MALSSHSVLDFGLEKHLLYVVVILGDFKVCVAQTDTSTEQIASPLQVKILDLFATNAHVARFK